MRNPEREQSFARAMASEWAKSWRTGLAALLCAAFGVSAWSAISSIFVEPLQSAFGWTRGQIAAANVATLLAGLSAPIFGKLIDRAGPRAILIVGYLTLGLCYGLFASMNGSLYFYYAVYCLFLVGGMGTTGISYTRLLAEGFKETRGTALAIARGGLALSGAILPLVLHWVISNHGWRAGYLVMILMVLGIALPATWALLRRSQGAQGPATPVRTSSGGIGAKMVFLCVAAALTYAPAVAIITQMAPIAISKNMNAQASVLAISVVSMSTLFGSFASGFLVDRFWAPAVAVVMNILPAIGCLILTGDNLNPYIFYACIATIGIGQGAEIDVVAYMISRYFDMKRYSSFYGLTLLSISIFASTYTISIGYIFDIFGNYDAFFVVASISFTIAAILYLCMGRYPSST